MKTSYFGIIRKLLVLLSALSFSGGVMAQSTMPDVSTPPDMHLDQQIAAAKASVDSMRLDIPKPPRGVIPADIENMMHKKTEPTPPPPLDTTVTDVSKPIMLAPGQKTLVINLQSNPSTGYSWFLTTYDHQFLSIHSHQFIAPPKDTHLVGASGVDQWILDVKPDVFVAPQSTTLTFVYKRSWEKAIGKTVTVDVNS